MAVEADFGHEDADGAGEYGHEDTRWRTATYQQDRRQGTVDGGQKTCYRQLVDLVLNWLREDVGFADLQVDGTLN